MKEIEDIYPLSPMQQGMLFHSLYAPASGMYIEQSSWVLEGDLNEQAFERAWKCVVARHAILRTSFVWEDLNQPLQVVHRQVELPVRWLDWREKEGKEQQSALDGFLQGERARGFDLSRAPLLWLAVIRLSDKRRQLIWCHHHILMDGWCVPLVLSEVLQSYEAYCGGTEPQLPPVRPFKDHIAWLQRQPLAKAKDFWKQMLAGFSTPAFPALPRPELAAGQDGPEYAIEHVSLSPYHTALLQAASRRHRLTLNSFVQAAWALVLGRYSGQDDIVFGVTVSGRPSELPGAERMVGLFINTVPLRVNLASRQVVLGLLWDLRAKQAAMSQFEHTSLLQIRECSDVPAGIPLFESILVYENYPVDPSFAEKGKQLALHENRSFERTNYPLTLVVSPGASMNLQLAYETGRLSRENVCRMLAAVKAALEGMAADVERPIADLLALSADDRHEQSRWGKGAERCEDFTSVQALISSQAALSPEAPALVAGSTVVSYRELEQRSDALTSALAEAGVCPESPVAVCTGHSPELVPAILSVLKAGAPYVPLDPSAPVDRISFMIRDAEVKVVLTTTVLEHLFRGTNAKVLCVDAMPSGDARDLVKPFPREADPLNAAYVIYTSGSTGEPKGTVVTHRSLANHALWAVSAYGLAAGDRTLQFVSPAFDASAEEIFPTLVSGATLVFHPDPAGLPWYELSDVLGRMGITVLHLPVAFWHQWISELEADRSAIPASLRLVAFGGESPLPDKVAAWQQKAGLRIRLLNEYGPTEATITTTCHEIPPSSDLRVIPIGRPIGNVHVHVLDAAMRPVPAGTPGELFVGGAGLARGYLKRSDLTAETFVPDPFGATTGERLYRTGDLVRYRPDGNLEFIGRTDGQVKLRGFRIEPGEIETALSAHPSIGQCVIAAQKDSLGDNRLVAYVVARHGVGELSREDLQAFLRQSLPHYMVPSAWVFLDRFPLTSNGKIDRRSLPAPADEPERSAGTFAHPATPDEELLASLWSSILGTTRVGRDDNFFALGGHSLRATQLVSRIRDVFGVEMPLHEVFLHADLAEEARSIAQARQKSHAGRSQASLVKFPDTGNSPLSFAQERLWFLDQLEPGSVSYNIPSGFRVRGPLDVKAFDKSLNELVRRHEALRTTFSSHDGKPVQIVHDPEPVQMPMIDLRGLEHAEEEIARLSAEEAMTPFDLSNGPLFRTTLLRLTPEDHIVLLTVHHIAADGWSISVIMKEVGTLYNTFSKGEGSSSLGLLPIQYRDYARWQRESLQGEDLAQEIHYWREALKGIPPILPLPSDRPRPASASYNGASCSILLSPELTESIHAFSRREGATVFMTLLAAFQTLLYRYSGQPDVSVGSPVAGRTQTATEGLIGFFVNTLVFRTQFGPQDTVRTVMRNVREYSLGAYAHQSVPFEKLVEELHPVRDLSHSPLFQVMFVFQNLPFSSLRMDGITIEPVDRAMPTANFDLSLTMEETGEGFRAEMEYSADLFDEETIRRMLGHLENLLRQFVADPEARVATLTLLSPEEMRVQVDDWNATAAPFPTGVTVHQRFEAIAERTPSAPALLFPDAENTVHQMSYGELNERANQLAHYLAGVGVSKETLVGICTERSPEMIVAILAVLKAGGAFVPLDPAYPKERLAFMLEDSGANVLLTQQSLLELLPQHHARVVCLDTDRPTMAQERKGGRRTDCLPENLAYVIYTSGSTGRPKGTMLQHHGLLNLAAVQRNAFQIDDRSRVFQFSSLSFDAAVWEIVMALLNGAALCLAPREVAGNPAELPGMLRALGVTTITLPPSVLAILPVESLSGLRTIILAGEACPAPLANTWSPDHALFNAYGPTETTVCAAMHECKGGYVTGPPIGRPIGNFRLFILDRELRPVPIGVPGELYIGGTGLARGYLRRPDLTAERFVPDPFGAFPGARLYKSGDLCRHRRNGEIEFLGRIDHQVKLRGFRIELGEIEKTLAAHPGVNNAVVVVRQDLQEKSLVAYLVMEGEFPSVAGWRSYLREKLPEYMIPASFVRLEAMPMTPSNKVDRNALPAPDGERPVLDAAYEPPGTNTEKALAGIVEELLGIKQPGIRDSFFDLGGHSLLATQYVSRIRERCNVELPLRNVFEDPTIAGIAKLIDQIALTGSANAAPPIKAVARETRRVKRSSLVSQAQPGGSGR